MSGQYVTKARCPQCNGEVDEPSRKCLHCGALIVSEEAVPDDTIIWRYFKLDRFVDILKTHCLWFSRPFKFDDRWEGLFPPSYVGGTHRHADANGVPREEFDREFCKRIRRHRYAHFVNCWHLSDHESDAMWRLYGLPKTGIAIQSTVGDVRECLRPHNDGRVIYYDPSREVVSRTIFGPHDILFKRSCFWWEQEYRFWFDDDQLLDMIEAEKGFREEDLSCGLPVSIGDMERLIKKIVVAPGASDEFIEHVGTTCTEHKRRWLHKSIERSYSDRTWESFNK